MPIAALLRAIVCGRIVAVLCGGVPSEWVRSARAGGVPPGRLRSARRRQTARRGEGASTPAESRRRGVGRILPPTASLFGPPLRGSPVLRRTPERGDFRTTVVRNPPRPRRRRAARAGPTGPVRLGAARALTPNTIPDTVLQSFARGWRPDEQGQRIAAGLDRRRSHGLRARQPSAGGRSRRRGLEPHAREGRAAGRGG